MPFWSTETTALFVPGIDSVRRLGRFTFQTGTTDYFATMGTRLLRGRGFDDGDRAGAPGVAVVSEGMATVLWPGQDAIGRCIRVAADTMPCTTVVGIAENAFQDNPTDDQLLRYYVPMDQLPDSRADALLLRLRGVAAAQTEATRVTLQRQMPGDGYVTVEPLGAIVARERRSWEFGAMMFAVFGALALLVAAVGLHGVVAYNVAHRTHELGIRTALGARAGDLVRQSATDPVT